MAQTSLKRRLAQGVGALGVLLLIAPPTAYAAMAVIDKAALAKLTEQLNTAKQEIEKLTEQLDFLKSINGTLQEQIDAIGRMGQIKLPMPNLGNLSGQVMQDAQCLKPNLEGLMPNLDFENLDFGSICAGRDSYKEALFVHPSAEGWTSSDGSGGYTSGATWEAQRRAREEVEKRRAALTQDVVTTGLAQADKAATETAEINQRATEDLEAAADAAETENERLAVIAQGHVLTNRQMVQQNQLMAQLVKIQSTMLLHMSVPVKNRPPEVDGGDAQ
jgi:hypothetical protein